MARNSETSHVQRWNLSLIPIPKWLAVTFLCCVFIFITRYWWMAAYLRLQRRCHSTAAVHSITGRPCSGDFNAPTCTPAVYTDKVTTREFCSSVFRDIYSLEQMGYVDENSSHVSKMISLDVGPNDVHYVFVCNAYVPWMATCSLESALGAVGHEGRVNVFVVKGMIEPDWVDTKRDPTRMVSLLSSLAELTFKYGDRRLNVMHVELEDLLEFSPLHDMGLNRRPALARFAVQLVLLWQFGGTVLDQDVVAVRGAVYRAAETAVEYGTRTVSSPAACHPFVYDAMQCAKSYALLYRPFAPGTGTKILDKAVEWSGRGAIDVRSVADTIVCRNGVVGNHCYYVERAPVDYIHRYCPEVANSKK